MRKFKVLLVSTLFALVFLLAQFYLLKYVPQQRKRQVFTIEGELSAALLRTIIYENIKSFTRICAENGAGVFLIDPDILKAVMTESKRNFNGTSCQYFCQPSAFVAFGVLLNQYSLIQKKLVLSLRKRGFKVSVYKDVDTRLLSIKKTFTPLVPCHILINRNDHTIHLVVFQERVSGFWWSASISSQDSWTGDQLYTNISVLKFGKYPSAFNRMQIVKVEMDGLRVNTPRYPMTFLGQIPTSKFIECNYTRAREFFQMYPRDNSPEANAFRNKAKSVLSTAKNKALDPLHIRFWLSSGTCLGWFRQCDTFAYANDVDFGVLISDYDVRLIAAMQKNKMALKHIFGKPEDSFELSFQAADMKLDLFFFYEENDYMWNGGTQAKTANKYKYIFPKFKLCWTEFLEMKMRIPCETEAYIEANYGKKWFHPVRHWDWKHSPANVKPNGRWPDSEMDQVLQLFEIQ